MTCKLLLCELAAFVSIIVPHYLQMHKSIANNSLT